MKTLTDGNGRSLYRWQIRIRSEEPVLIEFSEEHYEENAPMEEMGKLVWRTSYMHGAPNREVWWAMDRWDNGKQTWECVVDGKSKLRENAGPL